MRRHLEPVAEPVEAVNQIQAALPRLEPPLVHALDQIGPLVDKLLLALALGRRARLNRGAIGVGLALRGVLVLGENLEAGIEQVAAEE